MTEDEGLILQEVLRSDLPCELNLSSYNDAVSMQSKLKRYLRNLRETYAADPTRNPFENIEILLIKPRTIRFEDRRGSGIKLVPVNS